MTIMLNSEDAARMHRLRAYKPGDPYPQPEDLLWLIREVDYCHITLAGLCDDSQAAAQALHYRKALEQILGTRSSNEAGEWWDANVMYRTAKAALETIP